MVTVSLRHNHVSELCGLLPLAACTRLRQLDLRGNPCSQRKGHRSATLALFPWLDELDGESVIPVERDKAQEAHPGAIQAALEEFETLSPVSVAFEGDSLEFLVYSVDGREAAVRVFADELDGHATDHLGHNDRTEGISGVSGATPQQERPRSVHWDENSMPVHGSLSDGARRPVNIGGKGRASHAASPDRAGRTGQAKSHGLQSSPPRGVPAIRAATLDPRQLLRESRAAGSLAGQSVCSGKAMTSTGTGGHAGVDGTNGNTQARGREDGSLPVPPPQLPLADPAMVLLSPVPVRPSVGAWAASDGLAGHHTAATYPAVGTPYPQEAAAIAAISAARARMAALEMENTMLRSAVQGGHAGHGHGHGHGHGSSGLFSPDSLGRATPVRHEESQLQATVSSPGLVQPNVDGQDMVDNAVSVEAVGLPLADQVPGRPPSRPGSTGPHAGRSSAITAVLPAQDRIALALRLQAREQAQAAGISTVPGQPGTSTTAFSSSADGAAPSPAPVLLAEVVSPAPQLSALINTEPEQRPVPEWQEVSPVQPPEPAAEPAVQQSAATGSPAPPPIHERVQGVSAVQRHAQEDVPGGQPQDGADAPAACHAPPAPAPGTRTTPRGRPSLSTSVPVAHMPPKPMSRRGTLSARPDHAALPVETSTASSGRPASSSAAKREQLLAAARMAMEAGAAMAASGNAPTAMARPQGRPDMSATAAASTALTVSPRKRRQGLVQGQAHTSCLGYRQRLETRSDIMGTNSRTQAFPPPVPSPGILPSHVAASLRSGAGVSSTAADTDVVSMPQADPTIMSSGGTGINNSSAWSLFAQAQLETLLLLRQAHARLLVEYDGAKAEVERLRLAQAQGPGLGQGRASAQDGKPGPTPVSPSKANHDALYPSDPKDAQKDDNSKEQSILSSSTVVLELADAACQVDPDELAGHAGGKGHGQALVVETSTVACQVNPSSLQEDAATASARLDREALQHQVRQAQMERQAFVQQAEQDRAERQALLCAVEEERARRAAAEARVSERDREAQELVGRLAELGHDKAQALVANASLQAELGKAMSLAQGWQEAFGVLQARYQALLDKAQELPGQDWQDTLRDGGAGVA